MPSKPAAAAPAPHSWDLEHWPSTVYPHSESRGRYVVRMHREALRAEGALVRVGRELVVIGARYVGWLQRQAEHEPHFNNGPVKTRPPGRQNRAPRMVGPIATCDAMPPELAEAARELEGKK